MAKTTRRTTRSRRTVREELTEPAIAADDSINGEESMSEFHDNDSDEHGSQRDVRPRAAAAPRLSLPLTADGTAVDWERVRNAEKAKSIVGVGFTPSDSSDDGVFGADMLGLALDMISMSLVSTFKAAGYTVDSAEATRLSQADKDALIPRYTKVLAKHAPALGKYEDEIMAGVTTLLVFGGKFMALKKAATVTKFPQRVPDQPEPSPITPVVEP